jgi:hypothetical protein
MAHYATLDENNIVTTIGQGIDEDEYLQNLKPEIFYGNIIGKIVKRTSYNTIGGIHYNPITNQPSEDQTKAFRKNYAGIGYYYDEQRDAFIPPKPFPSWTLDEFSCLWESSIPYPNDGNMYEWNEETLSWDLANI